MNNVENIIYLNINENFFMADLIDSTTIKVRSKVMEIRMEIDQQRLSTFYENIENKVKKNN